MTTGIVLDILGMVASWQSSTRILLLIESWDCISSVAFGVYLSEKARLAIYKT